MADMENFYDDLIIINLYWNWFRRPTRPLGPVTSDDPEGLAAGGG